MKHIKKDRFKMLLVYDKYTVGIMHIGWDDEPFVICKRTDGRIGLAALTREYDLPIVTTEYVSIPFMHKIKHKHGKEVRIVCEYIGEYVNAEGSIPDVLSSEVISLWRGMLKICGRIRRGSVRARDIYVKGNYDS